MQQIFRTTVLQLAISCKLYFYSFLENKRVEHARQHFFPLPGQSVEWEMGEFLCPLCQCYCNTVLPLVPQVGQLSVGAKPIQPSRPINMQEWRELLTLAVDLCSGDAMDTGEYLLMYIHSDCQYCTYKKQGQVWIPLSWISWKTFSLNTEDQLNDQILSKQNVGSPFFHDQLYHMAIFVVCSTVVCSTVVCIMLYSIII